MKVEATARIEGIFAHAVAMDNRGLKNIIYCVDSDIYIVNFDYSMILRFSLSKTEASFETAISFNANEYDSREFEFTEDDAGSKIVFTSFSSAEAFQRKKICRSTNTGPAAEDISKLHSQLKKEAKDRKYTKRMFYLSGECVPLLDENLSHTEISVENSTLILRQRNVYTGTIIEISPNRKLGSFEMEAPLDDMPPIALKTKDFMSLFGIRKTLAFTPTEDFLMVGDPKKSDFDGILALCTYDTIIDLYQNANQRRDDANGREEQKTRSSEQKADRPHKKTKRRRRLS